MIIAIEFHIAPLPPYKPLSLYDPKTNGENPAGNIFWRPNPKNARNADKTWVDENGAVDPIWGNAEL